MLLDLTKAPEPSHPGFGNAPRRHSSDDCPEAPGAAQQENRSFEEKQLRPMTSGQPSTTKPGTEFITKRHIALFAGHQLPNFGEQGLQHVCQNLELLTMRTYSCSAHCNIEQVPVFGQLKTENESLRVFDWKNRSCHQGRNILVFCRPDTCLAGTHSHMIVMQFSALDLSARQPNLASKQLNPTVFFMFFSGVNSACIRVGLLQTGFAAQHRGQQDIVPLAALGGDHRAHMDARHGQFSQTGLQLNHLWMTWQDLCIKMCVFCQIATYRI